MIMDFMSTTKDIADDYYIKRLNNAEIFEKHKLSRKKSHISQERVFEYLPIYKHKALRCSCKIGHPLQDWTPIISWSSLSLLIGG